MKITTEKLEKKILALLFQLEARNHHITIENLVEEMLIGKTIANDILSGRASLLTRESLFSLNQQLYHRVGIFELSRSEKLLNFGDFDNMRDALKSFFNQSRYIKRPQQQKTEQ